VNAAEGKALNCPGCQKEIAEYSNFCYFCGARQHPGAAPAGNPMPQKRLMRSRDAKLGGVCGGIAEYMDVDPTVVRLVWVLVTFFTGLVPGLVAYLVTWLVLPAPPKLEVEVIHPAAASPNYPQAV
jgi:phage shock protein C